MDKTKLNLERLRAYDVEWNENKHPRSENGQFTSGSVGEKNSMKTYKFNNLDKFERLVKTAKHQAQALEEILAELKNFQFEMVLVDLPDHPTQLVPSESVKLLPEDKLVAGNAFRDIHER